MIFVNFYIYNFSRNYIIIFVFVNIYELTLIINNIIIIINNTFPIAIISNTTFFFIVIKISI